MTEHDEHHHDDSLDGDADRTDPALSSAEVAALTDQLRNEPVEIDELARERRIRLALAAMDEAQDPLGSAETATATETAPAPVPPPRRNGNGRVWLVAAAVAAVLGLGGLLASTLPDGSSDRAEQAGVALDAADAATTTVAASPELGEAPAADGGSGPVLREESAIDGDGSTSDTVGVTDLGAFASEAALRERVARFAAPGAAPESAPPPTEDDGRSPTTTAVPEVASSVAPSDCVLRRRAAGDAVLGAATVGGSPVVVIVDGDRIELVDDATCEAR